MEDVDSFNSVSELFHILQTPASLGNHAIEQFGYSLNICDLSAPTLLHGFTGSQTIMFQQLCCTFQQTRYFPLRWAPLEIEWSAEVTVGVVSRAGNTSVLWKIGVYVVKVDFYTLDSALDISYTYHFMSGKTINFVYGALFNSTYSRCCRNSN